MKIKTADICRCILRILADTDGHPLEEDVLMEHVDARLRPRPSRASFDDAITILKSEGYIRVQEGGFGGDEARWNITEKGETWLNK